MKNQIVNFGSINIDHVYHLDTFVVAGQTLPTHSISSGLGGKGANQSVALAKSGVEVQHLGRVSSNEVWVIDEMREAGVAVENIELVSQASGHAIIQIDKHGENAIIIHGGANQSFTQQQIGESFSKCEPGDFVLLQNECNMVAEAMRLASDCDLTIVFNPAPFTADVLEMPLELVSILIVNEGEAQALAAKQKIEEVEESLVAKFPDTHLVITQGAKGASVLLNGQRFTQKVSAKTVVDTTAAGDTFIGYYLGSLVQGMDVPTSLKRACEAAAIAVSRAGAISSIPAAEELGQ